MRQSEIDEWATALESGKYVQGRQRLCRVGNGPNGEDTWCCLGVKANLDVKAGRYGLTMVVVDGVRDYRTTPNVNSRTMLVHGAQLGLTTEQQNRLIVMNDDDRRSFVEIARWIRNNIQATDD